MTQFLLPLATCEDLKVCLVIKKACGKTKLFIVIKYPNNETNLFIFLPRLYQPDTKVRLMYKVIY